MLLLEELRLELENLKPQLDDLYNVLEIEKAKEEITELHDRASMPNFWDDLENSQKIMQRIRQLETKVEHFQKLSARFDDLLAMIELANEENDESLLPEISDDAEKFKKIYGRH